MLEIGPFQNHSLQVIERHLSHPEALIKMKKLMASLAGWCGDMDMILLVWSWKQEAGSFMISESQKRHIKITIQQMP